MPYKHRPCCRGVSPRRPNSPKEARMPALLRRPLLPSALVLAAFAVDASALGAEPPALLPNALLRQESDGPAAPAVNQPVRVRQTLRPGTTYEMRIKGTMKVDAVHEKFVPLL